jgi:hypothetical protein
MEPKFRTEVKIPDFRYKTGYAHKSMFLGSCFTENIGSRMAGLKYPVDINPFGILYNPESVANGLKILLNGRKFSQNDLVHHDGLWHSFSHHGRFSSEDADITLQQINQRLESSSVFLKTAGFLFITFGTAWVYRYKKSGETVANCHKIPDNEFLRNRLSVDEIVADFRELIDEIRNINPDIQIIFTVSPIRHWKDGAVENQRSKAALHLAIDEIISSYGENCSYFPAYELVMDELRDYRFYAPDMLHISDVAIDFIWNKFENALIDAGSRQLSVRVQKIVQAANHRPFNKNTPEYHHFLLQMQEKINMLEKEFKNIDFTGEKVYFFGLEK